MLLDYNSFLVEKRLVESRRQLLINIFNQFEEIKPVINEAVVLVEAGIFDEAFDMINEESLMVKMKQKFDNAVQIAKQKGKQALSDTQQKILKLGGDIANVIKLMVGQLKKWAKETFDTARSAYSNFAKSKVKEISNAFNNAEEGTKTLIIKEVKNLKTISKSVLGWMTAGLVKDVAKGSQEAATEEVKESIDSLFELAIIESINEAILLGNLDFNDMVQESSDETIPFVSSIAHKLHHVPPFNLLDKVKQGAEKITGIVLNKLSYYATEFAGAPGPFEFVALATIVGIVAEVEIKHAAKHALVHAIPGIGTFASIISHTAMALAIIGILEALISGDEKKQSNH